MVNKFSKIKISFEWCFSKQPINSLLFQTLLEICLLILPFVILHHFCMFSKSYSKYFPQSFPLVYFFLFLFILHSNLTLLLSFPLISLIVFFIPVCSFENKDLLPFPSWCLLFLSCSRSFSQLFFLFYRVIRDSLFFEVLVILCIIHADSYFGNFLMWDFFESLLCTVV